MFFSSICLYQGNRIYVVHLPKKISYARSKLVCRRKRKMPRSSIVYLQKRGTAEEKEKKKTNHSPGLSTRKGERDGRYIPGKEKLSQK